jgi:hypothetical protein
VGSAARGLACSASSVELSGTASRATPSTANAARSRSTPEGPCNTCHADAFRAAAQRFRASRGRIADTRETYGVAMWRVGVVSIWRRDAGEHSGGEAWVTAAPSGLALGIHMCAGQHFL